MAVLLRPIVSLAVFFAVLCGSDPTGAEPRVEPFLHGAVEIVTPRCTTGPLDIVETLAVLRVELASLGIDTRLCAPQDPCASSQPTTPRLQITLPACAPDQTEVVLLLSGPNRSVTSRRVVLSDTLPLARARALALAAGELLREPIPTADTQEPPPAPASEGEPTEESDDGVVTIPPQCACPPAPVPMPPPQIEPPPPALRLRSSFGVEAESTLFVAQSTALFGASGAYVLSLPVPLQLTFDASLLFGHGEDTLGEMNVLLGSFGLSLMWYQLRRHLQVALGPEVDVGWAHGFAHAREDGVSSQNAGGVLVKAAVSLHVALALSERVAASAAFGLGYVLRALELRAADRTVFGFSGPVVSLALGLRFF